MAEPGAPPKETSAPPPESTEAEEGSSFELLARILTGLVQAIEDGAELMQVMLREELARFRLELERRLAGVVVLLLSGGFFTAGVALLLHKLIADWATVLLMVAAVYLAVGLWLMRRLPDASQSEADKSETIQ